MLHLPLAHDCPACGGMHRPTRAELPAAAELRPYFGTYTPSKFPAGSGTTPLHYDGAPSGTIVNNFPTWNTLTISTSPTAPVTASGADLLTDRAGWFAIAIGGKSGGNGGGGDLHMRLLVGGAQVDAIDTSVSTAGGGFALYYAASLAASTAISLQGNNQTNSSLGIAQGHVRVTFVPTPTNPR